MDSYDIMQVCLNGHQITDSYKLLPQFRKDFCDKCGEKTIIACPKCNIPIKGRYSKVVIGFITPVPDFCYNCGAQYPWTERKSKTKITLQKEILDPLFLVEQICARFHLVACQLRQRHENRDTLNVNDEYDVQDLLHALLIIHFDDIRTEEWTPSYAGCSNRMDFLLKKESMVIETKKIRKGLGTKELGDQLIVDIQRYQKHPNCKLLFCFVYDPDGIIKNPRGIEKDLSKDVEGLTVKVSIVPKGY